MNRTKFKKRLFFFTCTFGTKKYIYKYKKKRRENRKTNEVTKPQQQ